jgi:hypothetical protein
MQIFNNTKETGSSSRNSKQSCSYCRDESHNASNCPHIAGDWAMFQKLTIPSSDPDHWTNTPLPKAHGQNSWNSQSRTARWFKDPTGWSKWYAQCEKANEKQLKAMAREKNKKQGKKKASKCGFCGSLDHNRRNCPTMDVFREDALKANRNWRQSFYDDLVGKYGISEGALLTVRKEEWNNNSRVEVTGTAIVASINWDELHTGCDHNFKGKRTHQSWRTDLEHQLKQFVRLDVIINGQRSTIALGDEMRMDTVSLGGSRGSYNWGKGQEWIDQGHVDAVDFVIKKRSYEWLKERGYVDLITKWSNKVS